MIGQIKFTLVLLCLALPLAACLNLKQPQNRIEYYSLEYDPPADGHHPVLPHVIRVQQFSISPIYNSNRIIYRDKSYQRQAYAYYKWRANPAQFVTYFLSRDLKASGVFKAVLPGDSRVAPVYRVEGTVDEFLEVAGNENWHAVLAVSIVLMDENQTDISQKVLFQKTYRTRKPCEQKHPRALAAAMSQAMSEISVRIIDDLFNHLAAGSEVN
jgi:cholesterol transport system auxiliary component